MLMNLDEQLEILLHEAPENGVPLLVMEKAISPVLKLFAKQLQHPIYYILQNRDRNWILTTLSHRDKPQAENTVIYAFATREDAISFQGIADSQILIASIPVTHLLFQIFALNQIDSIIFMEQPGNINQGKEIERVRLQNMIQQQIMRLKISQNDQNLA